jgi:hypothetical protein
MWRRDKTLGKLIVPAFSVLLALVVLGQAQPAGAAATDVAMFYDDLAQYGTWIDYGNYGPCWYPTRVGPNWRPYVDGRWVPTSGGWTFETAEPWGWATYHYGNWFPTTEYGWLWSPGSTWYPSTAAWRTSDYYMGWAPIPPPNYVPEPAFYPAGGYYPGMPLLDLVTAPFWIFAEAASFLLGFGQPFLPAYSYYNCGCLAPTSYVPVVYGGTFLLTDFYYPAYARSAYYCFGPPFSFVSRVTNVNITQINNFANTVNITQVRNVLPPAAVLDRRPFLRESIPASVREGRLQAHRVADITRAERELNRPGVVRPPANVPALSKTIPKVMVAPERLQAPPGGWQKVKGMGLPSQAERTLTPQMRGQARIQQRLERQAKPPARVETLPEFRQVTPKPEVTPGAARPGAPEAYRPAAPPEARPAPPRTAAPAPARELRAPPPEVRAAPRREIPAPAPQRQFRAVPPREFRSPTMPREFRSAPAPTPRPAPAPVPRAAPAPTPRPAPAAPSRPAPAPSRPAPAPSRGEHRG